MNTVVTWFNVTMSTLVWAGLVYLVMSRRVRDGIIIKIGLMFMALGFFGRLCILTDVWQSTQAIAASDMFVNIGLGIVTAGWLIRMRRERKRCRRTTDFAELRRE